MLNEILIFFRQILRMRDAAVVAEANRYMLTHAMAGTTPTEDQIMSKFANMSDKWSDRERLLFRKLCYEMQDFVWQLRDREDRRSKRGIYKERATSHQFAPAQETNRAPSNRNENSSDQ